MTRDILVFAGKVVGLDLVEFLFRGEYPVARVIAASKDDIPILLSAGRYGIPTEVYGPSTHQNLVDGGDRYRWLLNLWSPHLIRPNVLALADNRLNIHPSLVPDCRGNDNAAWTIRQGVRAGVSLLEMDATLDSGGVYAQREVAYEYPIRGSELQSRLLAAASAAFQGRMAGDSRRVRICPPAGPPAAPTTPASRRTRTGSSTRTTTSAPRNWSCESWPMISIQGRPPN